LERQLLLAGVEAVPEVPQPSRMVLAMSQSMMVIVPFALRVGPLVVSP
jgi:hypothetical protein